MTYITGQPILFVGTGQTYTDLKLLNAKSVVQSLTKQNYPSDVILAYAKILSTNQIIDYQIL